MQPLLPGLVLVALLAVAALGAYNYMSADRQVDRDLDRLSNSLTARPSLNDGGNPAADRVLPAIVPSNKSSAFPATASASLPLRTEAQTLPPKDQRQPPDRQSPSVLPGQPGTPLQNHADKAASGQEDVHDAFFASQSLEQLAAVFARAHGSLKPSQWGEHLPGITRHLDPAGSPVPGNDHSGPPQPGQPAPSSAPTHPAGKADQPVLALTLDACDGKKGAGYDSGIIAFLRERKIPATIFVTSLWIRNNPDALRELASDPLFEIAAHGSRHRPCSVNGNSVYGIKGTASFAELVSEVEGNVRDITTATGKRPRWFRAGTAYYDDVAVRVIRDLDLGIAGYSIAGDEGASLPAAKVAAKTLAAKNGDILLYHLNHPRSGTREGLERALPALLEKGFVFVRLSPEFQGK